MATTPETTPALAVPRWTNALSGWQARHPAFWIGLGNLETRMLGERLAGIEIDRPVWVTGVARSGTTILLELLARHPELASHRYRDFPPVLMPWFWNWFVDRAESGSKSATERAHGDGIEVTPESPEAFEEVIWMAFFGALHDPDISAALTAQTEHEEFEAFYRDHIRKILLIRGGRRYLSKANYNLTRLAYLLELFPDARFVVPIRDPVWHIASLMRQHERFVAEHARDSRLQHHMSRSGHFEFGLDRRPINSGDTAVSREVRHLWASAREVEGWALYWKDIHEHVADLLDSSEALRHATMVVDYDGFCNRPREVMQALTTHCELPSTDIDLAAVAEETIHPPGYYTPSFDAEQMAAIRSATGPVHERLVALAARHA